MNNLTDFYCWELAFDTGVVMNQRDNNALPRENRLNVNSPHVSYGRPVSISMRPQRFGLPQVSVSIPVGCQPYYALRTLMAGATPTGRAFVVGYSSGRERRLQQIDISTGAVFEIVETICPTG